MRSLLRAGTYAGIMLLLAVAVHAQESTATIAGIVKDASGAVLPGVTVEAASPELIEKVRTVVTDGTGQFRIVSLRPGTYTVTFSLNGVAGTQTLYTSVQNGAPAATIQSLTLAASTVPAGGTVAGTVTLSQAAPAGGAVLALSSNSPSATVPATVTVAAGATSATFTVYAPEVAVPATVTITATYQGSSATATLTVQE